MGNSSLRKMFWQRFCFANHIVAVSHFVAFARLLVLLPQIFAAKIYCTGHQMIHRFDTVWPLMGVNLAEWWDVHRFDDTFSQCVQYYP